MAYNLKSEEDVKEYIKNLGIEYRFGCYSEKNPEVCHLLGDYLEAIKKDFKKAGTIFKDNCDNLNYPKSCHKYGNYLLVGKGERKVNYATAYDYFEKGCNLGDGDACFHQGLLLTMTDVDKINFDAVKAMSLLEKSCLSKNEKACYYLSGMYIRGVKKPSEDKNDEKKQNSSNKYDVEKNMEKAFRFATEGCHLGNIYCCANLSQMYARGEGCEKNAEMAEKYKTVAMEMQNEMNSTLTLKFQQGLDD